MATILLIEDDKLMIKLYVGKLNDEGFEVLTAENGLDGLEMAKKNKPDLILLDILMPGLRGDSVLEELKKDPILKSTPVIMLTNLDKEELASRFKGANDFLIKAQNDPSDVIKIVKKHLNL
jgi:two-component system alkaline phosphatase synthesis response regulator PhoP